MAQPGPSSGLSQRRRGGAGGSTSAASPYASNGDDYSDLAGGRSSPAPASGSGLKHRTATNSPAGLRNATGGASSTLSGAADGAGHSHRIAYDPRDLKDEDEESLHPRLTLMEEILLLGLKDRQGYLSFWNDSISYSLRGCIILELVMRRRLGVVKDPRRGTMEVSERLLEVVSAKMTGEVLLDEALKLIKSSEEKRSIVEWIDLLSGETWNLSKIGYQLKQVRERLAKGLVDKGILRTEKRNFLLFDMATHPVADATAKKETLRRVEALSCGSSSRLPPRIYQEGESIAYPATRALLLVCSAFAANVLDNALLHLTYEAREATFQKIEDWLEVFGQWPMAPKHGGISGGAGPAIPVSFSSADGAGGSAASSTRRTRRAGAGGGPRIAEGSVLPDPADALGAGGGGGGHPGPLGAANMIVDPEKIGVATNELVRAMRIEAAGAPEGTYEAVAGVLAVLGRMDSLL
ncbi:GPP34-domain-containing protein [Microstroma glucosiphilum]|uniref:GPP34-domain-containing protein n=1 Tax=Pseudomicrostroma glucosiphilum TaxID=1684307 RepID=A0A316UDV6_9BASI|nr:GPP34-domain-containing protein [Pseudomicrostroma glucosiphilum]PWN23396.1 GPP34-domain-containing protein [Pseudomicrostroma glucosiphilum]